jgi:hypothetical protein
VLIAGLKDAQNARLMWCQVRECGITFVFRSGVEDDATMIRLIGRDRTASTRARG